jgi:predicted permease
LQALGTMPGVQSAVAAMKLPLRGGGDSFDITIEGQPDRESSFTYFRFVTPGWFETMGIHLQQGRFIDASDRAAGERVVVINEALAKKYFPGENPIGRRLGGGLSGWVKIVGIVANVAEAALTDEREPVRYYPAEQVPWFGNNITFVLRTTRPGDAAVVLDEARRTVQRVAPGLAVSGTTTMQNVFDRAVGPARQIMTLLSLLSALALLLGAIGIYGVISHFAARRKRDWAIRVALGLPGSRVMRHIVGHGASLVIVGIVLGAVGTAALSRLLASFLFGVSALDPVAFAGASAALLAIGIAAAFIPARRAGTVDPALVLREQ